MVNYKGKVKGLISNFQVRNFQMSFTGKQIFEHCFRVETVKGPIPEGAHPLADKPAEKYKFVCNMCSGDFVYTRESSTKKVIGGYSFAEQHIKGKKHKVAYEAFIEESISSKSVSYGKQKPITKWIDERTKNVYGWLNLIAATDYPLSYCEHPDALKYLTLEKIDMETLKKYLFKTSKVVEKKFTKFLFYGSENYGRRRPIGLVFDVWDDGIGTLL